MRAHAFRLCVQRCVSRTRPRIPQRSGWGARGPAAVDASAVLLENSLRLDTGAVKYFKTIDGPTYSWPDRKSEMHVGFNCEKSHPRMSLGCFS